MPPDCQSSYKYSKPVLFMALPPFQIQFYHFHYESKFFSFSLCYTDGTDRRNESIFRRICLKSREGMKMARRSPLSAGRSKAKIHSEDVKPAENGWATCLACRGAAERRAGHLPERLLRTFSSSRGFGAALSVVFPHRVQNHRRRDQRNHGLSSDRTRTPGQRPGPGCCCPPRC